MSLLLLSLLLFSFSCHCRQMNLPVYWRNCAELACVQQVEE